MTREEGANNTNSQNTTVDETSLWLAFIGFNSPLMILGLLIVCINATILIVFARKRPLKTATNYFLVGMAVTDLMTGLFSIPFSIACNATYHYREDLCHVKEPFYAFTSLSTIAFIATITTDRYIAITKPLRYKVLLTKKRARFVITGIWISAVFLALLPLVWVLPGNTRLLAPTEELQRADRIFTIVILCPIILAFPLMVYTYVKIFKEIRRQRKITHDQSRLTGCAQSTMAQEIRTVSIFCVMLAGYVFCWAPFAVLRLLYSFNYEQFPEFYIVSYCISILPFLTSFLNPCCYGFGKKDFRGAISESTHCNSPRFHVVRKHECTAC